MSASPLGERRSWNAASNLSAEAWIDTSLIANDSGHKLIVEVSNFAQTPDGQRRSLISIDTPSQSVRSSIQLAEPEPIRVSVASLRNMSSERKYHAITFNPARRIADA